MQSFQEIELVYANELKAEFYRPDIADSEAVHLLVDIHGGAWSFGHRKRGRYYCRALAAQGIASLAIDFRQGETHKHPAASEDIARAIQFTQSLDIEARSLGLVGHSSGGHLALLSGLCPYKFTDTPAENIPLADFLIALWPVSDPISRYQYARSRNAEAPETWEPTFRPDKLLEGHQLYFGDEEIMASVAIQQILRTNEHTHLPRVFIAQPALDQNVPVLMSRTLHGALLAAGCDATLKIYPEVGHSFAQKEGPQTENCIKDMIDFVFDTSL
ncbi:MAG: alpha/beta hydrolase [Pseudomonadota bacterium]